MRQLKDKVQATRREIQDQTRQIEAAGVAVKNRRGELESLQNRIKIHQAAFEGINVTANGISASMQQLDQELQQARERTQLLEQHIKDAEAARQAAARSGQLEGDGGGGIPDAAWGLLAAAGLFGAGALIEAGGIARLWPRGRVA